MTDNSSVPRHGMHARLGPGSRIAGYMIEEQIGAGGMAVVFRARDETLGRLAAVKVLSPALAADQEFRARFLRESRLVAAVDEPHIVPVYGAGESDGVLYIATRFIPGGDLAGLQHRVGGPLGTERGASIIAQVSAALDAAHAIGLVHRDVKPGNVLIDNPPGRPERAYLSDFGLSKATSSTSGLTASGAFMGTPDYCAPEQITGHPPVSARTDQYALGCVAFSLLSGIVPYPREETLATLFAHLQAPVPSLAALCPELPEAVDAVLARAMAKSPAGRYDSCGEFAAALQAALARPAGRAASSGAAGAPSTAPAGRSGASEPAAAPGEPTAPVLASSPPAGSLASAGSPASAGPGILADAHVASPETVTISLEGSPPAQARLTGSPLPADTTAIKPPPMIEGTPGAWVPATRPPRDPAAAPGTGSAPPARRRKKVIVAGSAAGAVLLAGGIAAAVALSGAGGSGGPGGSGESGIGSSAICPQGGSGATGGGPVRLPVPDGDCIVGSPAYSPDGRLLAAHGGNNLDAVYVWNEVTHKYVTTVTLPPSGGQNSVLAFSPDDKTLTNADSLGDIYQADLATGSGQASNRLNGTVNASASGNVAISSDGSTLAVTDNAGDGVAIINVATKAITATLTDPDLAPLLGVSSPSGQFPGTALSLSADGSRLTVGDSKGNLYVWNVRSRQVIVTLGYDPAKAGRNFDVAAIISGGGNLIFIPDGPGGLAGSLWSVASRANVTPHDARWPKSAEGAFSSNGQFIATVRDDGSGADLWNVATRAHVASVSFGSASVTLLRLSPDGKEILTADGNVHPLIWRFP